MKKEEKIKRKDYTWKRKTEQMQDKDMKSSVIFVKEKQRHAFKKLDQTTYLKRQNAIELLQISLCILK